MLDVGAQSIHYDPVLSKESMNDPIRSRYDAVGDTVRVSSESRAANVGCAAELNPIQVIACAQLNGFQVSSFIQRVSSNERSSVAMSERLRRTISQLVGDFELRDDIIRKRVSGIHFHFPNLVNFARTAENVPVVESLIAATFDAFRLCVSWSCDAKRVLSAPSRADMINETTFFIEALAAAKAKLRANFFLLDEKIKHGWSLKCASSNRSS
jgi:hypothetical protein